MSDTARAILDLAERFLTERGYHAFSFADIARPLDIKPAAVHYHFRTKPELVVAVLARYRGRFRRWGRSVREDDARAQLTAYVALSRDLLRQDRIDPFGTLAGEFRQLPAPVQDELRGLQQDIFGWFAGLLASGRASGALVFDGEASTKAATLACALLGAQQLGRVAGAAAFEEVAGQVVREVCGP